MSKEWLEEIKRLWEENNEISIDPNDYERLIQQAEEKVQLEERVKELEKVVKRLRDLNDYNLPIMKEMYEENQRYKQALEKILFAGPRELVNQIARQALQGDNDG